MTSTTLQEREFTVSNSLGMHARPAALFVKTAAKFNSAITISKKDSDTTCDGKSVIGVLMLAASKGSQLVVTAEGQDATEALDAIEKLFEDQFGEN